MDIQGVSGAPYKHPITRRKIPAPFTRPTINSTAGNPVKRSWKDTPVTKIKPGDNIAGFGVVDHVVEFVNTGDEFSWKFRFYNVMDEYRDFGGHDRLYSFSTVDKDSDE